MFRDYNLFLFDILLAIKKIKIFTRKFQNADDLKYSILEWDAVLREFEVIGEATNYLIKANIFDDSKRVMVDFRNILIHKYFGVDENEVWQIIKNIDILEMEILEMIKSIDNKNELINKIKLEYKNKEILEFLDSLKEIK